MLKSHLYLFASSVLAAGLGVSPALAAPADDASTITVTGSPLALNLSAPSVSIVTTAAIDAVQGPDLTRVLARLPGVSFSRNGPLGGVTSLFVRGGDSDQVLMLVDGVKVGDLSSPSGNYDLGTLSLSGIERIELLRGSNSVVWGSQAMAGVLAITTREANGVEASAEGGAYGSNTEDATVGLKRDRWAVSLNGGHVHSDGFAPTVFDSFNGGTDQWRGGARARVTLADGLSLSANGRYADTRQGIDQFGSFAEQLTRDTSGGLALNYATGPLHLTAAASLADVRRHYVSTPYPSDYQGLSERGTLTGDLTLPLNLRLDFGAEHEWTRAFDTYDARHTATLDSGHVLLGYYSDRLTLAAGGRVDSHSQFGSHWTGGANAALRLAGALRLRASYGEGFKAPSLYQLYAGYGTGNPALQPETSRSYDAGLQYGDRSGPVFASLTWFKRDTRNLIYYDNSNFTYFNTANASVDGVEIEGGVRPVASLAISGNFTWMAPRDVSNARDLARRPRNTLNLAADWQAPLKGLALGVDFRLVSAAIDYNSAYNLAVGSIHNLPSYTLVTLHGSYDLTARVQLFARLENVGDTQYQTAYSYNSAGRSGYAGLRVKY